MSTKQVGPIQFQGKLGTIVGRATRKGTMSLAMAPTKYTNPNTPKQVTARARFLSVTSFTKAVPREAFAGFVRAARSGKMSLNNYAFKNNMAIQNRFDGWNTDPVIETPANTDYQSMARSLLKFSEGIYPSEAGSAINVDTPGTVKVTFNKNAALPAAEGTKKVQHVVVYCQDADIFIHNSSVVDASTQVSDVTVAVPATWTGLRVYVYAYTQFVEDGTVDVDYHVYSNICGVGSWMDTNSKMTSSQTDYLGTAEIG